MSSDTCKALPLAGEAFKASHAIDTAREIRESEEWDAECREKVFRAISFGHESTECYLFERSTLKRELVSKNYIVEPRYGWVPGPFIVKWHNK